MQKVASRLSKYPVGQKFCQNHSISLRFRDKQVFAFKAEIQDGCQKWREYNFWEKSPVESADTLWVKNFVEITQSCSISKINAFLGLCRNSRWPPEVAEKRIFEESCQKTL